MSGQGVWVGESVADLPRRADVAVVGAGLVGAAVAVYLARAGMAVCVLDRVGPAAGTSSAGEGDILVSDKLPGPELTLALRSLELWHDLAAELSEASELSADIEFETKGGLVVATGQPGLARLRALAARQRAAGVRAEPVDAGALSTTEPHLAADLTGGVHYPQDCQVQPMLAVAALLRIARRHGARVVHPAEVRSATPSSGGSLTVRTSAGGISVAAVVNAAGPWSAEVARGLGTSLPVRPRRGHILVTEPLPPMIRHKVYESDYVDTVGGHTERIAFSAVVEGTASGTVLIGSSREFVDRGTPLSLDALATLARRAIRIFPFLDTVRAIRAYTGSRPASPDHLPVIGADPRVPGLYHATGHEGAGVGLAPATGELVAALLTGARPAVDAEPFRPARFAGSGADRDPGTGGDRT